MTGVEQAARFYFGKPISQLDLPEAAMLAGLVQAPSALRPTKHYERAEKRMRLVLGAMVAAGYLTETEADLPSPRLDVRTRNELPTGTYFADWALPILRSGAERSYEAQLTLLHRTGKRSGKLHDRVDVAAEQARHNLGGAERHLIHLHAGGTEQRRDRDVGMAANAGVADADRLRLRRAGPASSGSWSRCG